MCFLTFAERRWMLAHGFFVIMGGFKLYDSDAERPLYPLDLENIEKLVQNGAIDFPRRRLRTGAKVLPKKQMYIL
jgi:hypothetical protein